MSAGKKKLWISGQLVEVTDEVYRAYTKGDRKMRYFERDLKTERYILGKENQIIQVIPSREDSLDRLMEETARQFPDEQESVEHIVLHKADVDKLHTALSTLSQEEQALIYALFFEERSERDVAREFAVSQTTIHKRKIRILQKLKTFFEN